MIAVVHGAEDAVVGAGIQSGRSLGVDSKSGDPQIRKTSVHRHPMIAVVHGAEDAVVGAGIQSGRSLGVDSKSGDPQIRESSVHRCPCVPAVRGAEDATAVGTGIQNGGSDRVDDKRGKNLPGDTVHVLVGKTSVYSCPVVAAVCRAEDATIGVSVEGSWDQGVDDKRHKRLNM